ncbi:hypothetical protein EDB92DRAFT_1820498 [Lactarius akahatsu]|uniref:NACHT domain-containing protein n=1 Tax=Lactarius akahatsu TaxID=416441 RepID=A0AAD4L717_9AGAM|nr:hypothetical protein EDB92DRAFT_1820498 [Lactarius akahatsu]
MSESPGPFNKRFRILPWHAPSDELSQADCTFTTAIEYLSVGETAKVGEKIRDGGRALDRRTGKQGHSIELCEHLSYGRLDTASAFTLLATAPLLGRARGRCAGAPGWALAGTRSSPGMLNDGASRDGGIAGFGGFTDMKANTVSVAEPLAYLDRRRAGSCLTAMVTALSALPPPGVIDLYSARKSNEIRKLGGLGRTRDVQPLLAPRKPLCGGHDYMQRCQVQLEEPLCVGVAPTSPSTLPIAVRARGGLWQASISGGEFLHFEIVDFCNRVEDCYDQPVIVPQAFPERERSHSGAGNIIIEASIIRARSRTHWRSGASLGGLTTRRCTLSAQSSHQDPLLPTTPMSQTTTAASSRFQLIFNAALYSYQKQTKNDLIAHPLASQLQSCHSTSAILAVLQGQVQEFDQAHSGDERLTKWLIPTVNVLYAFSAAVSEGVGLVFSPAKAAKDVAASKDTLAELFERIGFFFNRLESYTEVTPTAAMTNIITKIMVEVLMIFGIATKELRRGSAKKFLKKLAGRTDLEDAVKKLDRLTQEEARMALAEVLKITHIVRDDVKVVDGKVENIDVKVEDVGDKVDDVGDKVDDVGDKVDDVGDKVVEVGGKVDDVGSKVDDVGGKVEDMGDRVQSVDEKLQVAIDDGKETRVVATATKSIVQQMANSVDHIQWNQIKQLLRAWLSPADPSTNHNIARKAQHKGTTVWFFQGSIFIEWKSTGSLLWIHGKPGSGKSVICSSVVQDIMALCEAGSAIMAYFYFDFRDLKKQTRHDLLLSLVFQLSTRSSPCCDVLHHVYTTHEDGTRQPSDDTLKECLKEMLRLLGHGPTFIVLDALDECPDSPGIPSPRHEVLELVKELVDLGLDGLHICATSRPEVDIRVVLDPLASRSISLHNQTGQQTDITGYVRNVVNSSPSTAMRRWRADDRNLVIETLTERADGMFRWVFCQLDMLQHCLPSNLRQFLNELPESLDDTYEWILRGIKKAQKDNARRLLQCLAVAVRPLRVEELAELLAFDFQGSSSGGIPKLKDDWRWDDQEEAVLSTCSSLIAIVPSGDSQVVQFSHFSVKEYLTSPRLAQSQGDVSRFHIDLEAAHTILAQACLGTLLRLDEHADAEGFPLVEYAARHWVDHARFDGVSSLVRDGMDDLFDSSKPQFAAWLRVHNVDKERWSLFSYGARGVGSPLYYAAVCGFYDLAERLIMKHPEQVNVGGGRLLAPLPAAVYKRHFDVANLLHKHGAIVDVRGDEGRTQLYVASFHGRVDIMRWLLNHGADPNIAKEDGQTPLHTAAANGKLEGIQVLLEHNADVNMRSNSGKTPLYRVVHTASDRPDGKRLEKLQRLLEHGADPNACDNTHSTPLHQASSMGLLEFARLLVSYGANVDEKDGEGRTPFQVATHQEMTTLLLEHGAVAQP